MVISIKTAHGYLSAVPPPADSIAGSFEYKPECGAYEQFDVGGLETLVGAIAALLTAPVTPPPPPKPPQQIYPSYAPDYVGRERDWFSVLVFGKPFDQQTLLDLEPTFNAAGWLLTPPNAKGERTKLKPGSALPWTRVGFGEGQWVWIPQAEQ